MPRFEPGEDIVFTASKTGRKFEGFVINPSVRKGKIEVRLTTDPFPVMVKVAQVSKKEKPVPVSRAKMLRLEAKDLGIKDWASLSLSGLEKAVADANNPQPVAAEDKPPTLTPKKAASPTTKKETAVKTASAKKVARAPKAAQKSAVAAKKAKKAPVATKTPAKAQKATKTPTARKIQGGSKDNPFRAGSNSHRMTEELLRGGRRVEMIKRLRKTMRINPWSKDKEENPEKAIDKRLLITAATLKKDYGFSIVVDGRGTSGSIKAVPPGSAKSNGQTAKKTASSKRIPKKAAAKR